MWPNNVFDAMLCQMDPYQGLSMKVMYLLGPALPGNEASWETGGFPFLLLSQILLLITGERTVGPIDIQSGLLLEC